MKQTAVEWLVTILNQKVDYIPLYIWDDIRDIVQQAKAMEREQIEDAFKHGKLPTLFADNLTAKEYYNEIYERKPNL